MTEFTFQRYEAFTGIYGIEKPLILPFLAKHEEILVMSPVMLQGDVSGRF